MKFILTFCDVEMADTFGSFLLTGENFESSFINLLDELDKNAHLKDIHIGMPLDYLIYLASESNWDQFKNLIFTDELKLGDIDFKTIYDAFILYISDNDEFMNDKDMGYYIAIYEVGDEDLKLIHGFDWTGNSQDK